MDPKIARQLGDGPIAPDCCPRYLCVERRAVILPFRFSLLPPRRFVGQGATLATCLIFGVQLRPPAKGFLFDTGGGGGGGSK